ncbi:hypothetical protein [Rubellicoccus peritrichatus]|uniref:Uncharacterized protein n=1 Tax=Rubellicoccus peritrichatus TaxID=3080537 RepID=A0AAQ3L9V1_9BACT|nr:hypothetical protein [Puniceicoccus sp. CR14]WOO40000.1 hypothetical protein RZN69_15360 [Puniceicoccus sp. CR14]
MKSTKRLLLLGLLALFSVNTSVAKIDEEDEKSWEHVDDKEIRAELSNYAEDFSGLALTLLANDSFEEASTDEQIAILGWAYRTVPYVRELQYEVNPAVGLVDLVIMTSRMNNYMATDEAIRYYGSLQDELAKSIEEANAKSWAMVGKILNSKEYLRFYKKVYHWVHKHPMTGYIGRQSVVGLAADRDLVTGIETAAPSFFLGDLGSQLQDTTLQMHYLNLTAERIEDQIEWMPIYSIWIAKIFILQDIGKSSMADAIDSVSQLSAELAPLQELSRDLDSVALNLKELNQLQNNVQRLARDLNKLTATIEPGIKAIAGLDEKTGNMTAQLQGMALEAKQARNTLDAQKDELKVAANSLVTLANFTSKSETLVWTATKAALVVIVAFFLCLMAYRIILSRFRKS